MPPKKAPAKKAPVKKTVSDWNIFLKQYVKANPHVDFGTASKQASAKYAKWKTSKKMVGGSVLSSINEFIWKYLAAPIGRAISSAVTTKHQARRY